MTRRIVLLLVVSNAFKWDMGTFGKSLGDFGWPVKNTNRKGMAQVLFIQQVHTSLRLLTCSPLLARNARRFLLI